MKAKLIIDNKELEVEISEEELKKLESKPSKMTGYERVVAPCEATNPVYYDCGGEISWCGYHDENDYKVANYYSSKEVAENNTRADTLMRQLRRFAVEHREKTLDWIKNDYYEIYHNAGHNTDLKIEVVSGTKFFGTIQFDTYEIAELAIDTFYDELIWYFTEYKDSL